MKKNSSSTPNQLKNLIMHYQAKLTTYEIYNTN